MHAIEECHVVRSGQRLLQKVSGNAFIMRGTIEDFLRAHIAHYRRQAEDLQHGGATTASLREARADRLHRAEENGRRKAVRETLDATLETVPWKRLPTA